MNDAKFTITANNVLVLPEELLRRYGTRKFFVIPTREGILVDPADDDGENEYRMTAEGEEKLKESVADAQAGNVYPVESLFSA